VERKRKRNARIRSCGAFGPGGEPATFIDSVLVVGDCRQPLEIAPDEGRDYEHLRHLLARGTRTPLATYRTACVTRLHGTAFRAVTERQAADLSVDDAAT